jgi:hypothetical protein
VLDQLTRKQIDARVPLERAVRELWQFQVVLARQMLAYLAHLVLDDVMIVTQPFFGPDAVLIPRCGSRQRQVNLVEPVRAPIELREQRTSPPRIGRQPVRRRYSGGMGLELIGGEQLRRRSARHAGS